MGPSSALGRLDVETTWFGDEVAVNPLSPSGTPVRLDPRGLFVDGRKKVFNCSWRVLRNLALAKNNYYNVLQHLSVKT